MLIIFLFIFPLQSLKISTSITQHNKLTILDNDQIHPWFTQQNQSFIDWELNEVRQFIFTNQSNHEYAINITVRVIENNQKFIPFIQESLKLNQPSSEILRFTLLPNQEYKLNIEYNCSSNTDINNITIFLDEQTLKHNSNLRDMLIKTNLQYFKQCANPQEPLFDLPNFVVLLIAFLITIFCAITNMIIKNKHKLVQFQLLKQYQLIFLLFIPIISLLFSEQINQQKNVLMVAMAFFSLWDFLRTLIPFNQPTIISFITSFIIYQVQLIYNTSFMRYAYLILCILLASKRIVLKTNAELFIFLVLIWLQEINWLAHLHTIDRHVISFNEYDSSSHQAFITSLTFSENKNESWNEKQIDIQLYQLISLTLINCFNIKNGLFNKEHIQRLIFIAIFQVLGLLIFDLLYRNKLHPPFLTIVTGCMLLGMAVNYWITGKGFETPYIKFFQFNPEENVKLKVIE